MKMYVCTKFKAILKSLQPRKIQMRFAPLLLTTRLYQSSENTATTFVEETVLTESAMLQYLKK